MSSSPTYTVVDQFDEDEFPDIPKAPAALLAALNTVPDPRKPRGLRHSLPGILAIAACAVIAGARSFVAIAEWAAAATPAALAKLGVTGEVPSESSFRRTINKLDGNGLDLILGAWAALREVNPKELRVIAVDGKSVRGSATAITRSSFGFTSRSAAQAPRMKSRPLPSSLLMVRRKVDSLGTSPVSYT